LKKVSQKSSTLRTSLIGKSEQRRPNLTENDAVERTHQSSTSFENWNQQIQQRKIPKIYQLEYENSHPMRGCAASPSQTHRLKWQNLLGISFVGFTQTICLLNEALQKPTYKTNEE